MTTLLRGATAVRSVVAGYLSATVPVMIDEARVAWNLTDQQLQYPEAYDAYEPTALDRWPLLGINITRSDTFVLMDLDAEGGQTYLAQYSVRVFTWCRTPFDSDGNPLEPEYEESMRMRDDLAAVVRSSLLKSASLGQPGAVMLNPSTLTEEYSEPTIVKGDRWVSGVIHGFDMRFDESVPLVPVGELVTLSITGMTINERDEEEATP
jgi:hypothetical protein